MTTHCQLKQCKPVRAPSTNATQMHTRKPKYPKTVNICTFQSQATDPTCFTQIEHWRQNFCAHTLSHRYIYKMIGISDRTSLPFATINIFHWYLLTFRWTFNEIPSFFESVMWFGGALHISNEKLFLFYFYFLFKSSHLKHLIMIKCGTLSKNTDLSGFKPSTTFYKLWAQTHKPKAKNLIFKLIRQFVISINKTKNDHQNKCEAARKYVMNPPVKNHKNFSSHRFHGKNVLS